jgi:hypothetical protein
MKTVLAALMLSGVFAVSAAAQDEAAMAMAQAACGPKGANFDVTWDSAHVTPQPESGKALVYVIENVGAEQCRGCATTKVGMDGNWMGANKGDAYFFFPVSPGEHHLCANWQSAFGWSSRNGVFAMTDFNAEAGHTYYFEVRVAERILFFDLHALNDDQGKYLVACDLFSVSHPKK